MGKRSREDVDVAVDASQTSQKKAKKGDKHKREKQKRIEKALAAGLIGTVGDDAPTAAEPAVEQKEESGLTKEERKAAKRAEKEAAKAAALEEATQSNEVGNDEEAVAAAKAARKAQRKAERAAKREKGETNGTNGHAVDEESTTKISATVVGSQVSQADADAFFKEKEITVEDPLNEGTRPILSFDNVPFDAETKKAFFTGFSAPTPIQSATWPYLINGRDVIGVAETGSGKTYAFGVPCIKRLQEKTKRIQVCIVSPTRELALQIQEQMVKLGKPRGIKATCVYGGMSKDDQRYQLKDTMILVATPGRLNDFLGDGTVDLSHVKYLVLDEADRMLDKGFEQDIRKIITAAAPSAERQTVMFTATWPPSVRDLASEFLRQPVKILIGDNASGELRANTRIVQEVEVIDEREKQGRLLQLLKQYQTGKNKNDRVLVFCLYKKEATRIEEFIRRNRFPVSGIHGDLSQQKRMESLEAFKQGHVPLLVATDVAARGLDIPAVKLVINVTFPLTVEDYVHRIGRTGRAGQNGRAITLFTQNEKALAGALMNVLKAANQPIPEELMKFGSTVKKKGHDAYGAFYKDIDPSQMKKATKITFD